MICFSHKVLVPIENRWLSRLCLNMTKEKNSSVGATVEQNHNIALSPQQEEVVRLRGRHLQVIACAVESPASIIAFTFTERAAAELKERILLRVEEAKGTEFLSRLAPMFIGTIHSYCFRLLQTHVPQYGNYDVLDEHRHVGLLSREFDGLRLGELGHRQWKTIGEFVHGLTTPDWLSFLPGRFWPTLSTRSC